MQLVESTIGELDVRVRIQLTGHFFHIVVQQEYFTFGREEFTCRQPGTGYLGREKLGSNLRWRFVRSVAARE